MRYTRRVVCSCRLRGAEQRSDPYASTDGRHVARGGANGLILLDIVAGKRVAKVVGMTGALASVAFLADGLRLYAVAGAKIGRREFLERS